MMIKLLELYSGIGGIHFSLKSVKNIKFEVVAAFDINHLCNLVYMNNFKNTKVFSKCITSLSAADIDEFEVNMITMSPPCQPFTLVGKQKDIDDSRSDSLKHILDILSKLKKKPEFIFVENVAAFEKSQMRDQLICILANLSYVYQEFLLNPLQFGIPNSRLRYYLIARLQPNNSFSYDHHKILMNIPCNFSLKSPIYINNLIINDKTIINDNTVDDIISDNNLTNCLLLENYLEDSIDFSPYYIPDKLLLKFWIMDIVNSKMKKSCCFTRRYGRYIEGAGSVIQMHDSTFNFSEFKSIPINSEILDEIKQLKLRFFTPKEIANLLHLPQEFDWPSELTLIQKYRLLGSSLNVEIVSKLLQLLLT